MASLKRSQPRQCVRFLYIKMFGFRMKSKMLLKMSKIGLEIILFEFTLKVHLKHSKTGKISVFKMHPFIYKQNPIFFTHN